MYPQTAACNLSLACMHYRWTHVRMSCGHLAQGYWLTDNLRSAVKQENQLHHSPSPSHPLRPLAHRAIELLEGLSPSLSLSGRTTQLNRLSAVTESQKRDGELSCSFAIGTALPVRGQPNGDGFYWPVPYRCGRSTNPGCAGFGGFRTAIDH